MDWNLNQIGVVSGHICQVYDCGKDMWYQVQDLHHEHLSPATGLLTELNLLNMNRFLEDDSKQFMGSRRKNQGHAASTLNSSGPLPFVLGSDGQLGALEIFDFRSNEFSNIFALFFPPHFESHICLDECRWILLHTFARSNNAVHCMVECALSQNCFRALTRDRGYSKARNLSQRRGSKIMGMQSAISYAATM